VGAGDEPHAQPPRHVTAHGTLAHPHEADEVEVRVVFREALAHQPHENVPLQSLQAIAGARLASFP